MRNEQNNGLNNVTPNNGPTELDPCMEDSKKEKIRVARLQRYRDKISEKYGLSENGVYVVGGIIILAVLLLIIVIILASLWPRIPHEYQYPVCTASECFRSASEVSSKHFFLFLSNQKCIIKRFLS